MKKKNMKNPDIPIIIIYVVGSYSDKMKEKEDDIITILTVFECVRKQIVLPDTYKLLFCEMGLFHNCCVSWSLIFLS